MDVSATIRGLRVASSELMSYKRTLNTYINSITLIKSTLSMEIKYKARINADLNTILRELYVEKQRVNKLSTVLDDIAIKYQNTENAILNNYNGGDFDWKDMIKNAENVIINSNGDYEGPEWIELLMKIVGSAGIFGTTIESIYGMGTADSGFEISANGVKGIAKLIKQCASGIDAGAEWWEALFGVNAATCTSFTDELAEGVVKSSKVATGAMWAGNLVDVLLNGYENYEEAGGKITERAINETIIESGVDIGMGIVLGAAATAVGATVGAPVVLVGAAAAAAGWAINEGCKALTGGKDVGEVVADFTLDVVEPAVKKARETVTKAVKEGAEKVGNAAKRAWEGVTSSWGKFVASW